MAAVAPPPAPAADVRYLSDSARSLLKGCQIKAADGTVLYTPDGRGNYRALWTRDFAYMVENAGDLIPLSDVAADLRYLLSHQRSDGAIPDRVQADGVAVYSAGPAAHPFGAANLDNPPFVAILADAYLSRSDGPAQKAFLDRWLGALDRGMDFVPRGASGLVYNDPAAPHSPYGFTDSVAKTGELFMESLLYWNACRRLEHWHRVAGSVERAEEYRRRANLIERGIGRCYDSDAGGFWAATGDDRQIDIWGNIYALYLKFPLGERHDRVLNFLVTHRDQYLWHGQVRSLLAGEYWNRMFRPIQHDHYQNGAYWATASGWLITVFAEKHPLIARQILADLVADFRSNGICECVTADYRKLPTYVVSATNPLAAARLLPQKR